MAQYLGTSHLFRGDSITIEPLAGNNGEIVTLDSAGKLLASSYTLGGSISGSGSSTQIPSSSSIVTWVNAQGFLTSESDTLQTVTNRGASTSHSITTGGLTTTGNAVIGGDLTVNGTVTTINTVELKVSDNIITLNNDVTGTPTENAGMEVERGTSANVELIWNEATDRWTFTNDGSTFFNIPITSEYDKYGSWQIAAGGTSGQTAVNSNATVSFNTGGGLTATRSGTAISYTHASASWGGMSALTGASVISDINIDGYGHISSVSTRSLTLADIGYTGPTNPDNYGSWSLSANGGTSTAITSGTTVDFASTGAASVSRSGNVITIEATNTTYSAGSGLSLAGTTFSHANTSSQANLSGTALNVVNSLTFDTYGHVTGAALVNLQPTLDTLYDKYSKWRLRANSGTAVDVTSNSIVSIVAGTNTTVTRSGTSITVNAQADAKVKSAEYAEADFTSGAVTFTHNLGTSYISVTMTLWNTTTSTGEVVHGEVTIPNANSVTINKGITLGTNERIRIVVIGA